MGDRVNTMKVPLLDLRPQLDAISGEIKQAVNEVIDSTQYILGPKVETLESEIADYCGAAHGIGVTSGTDALLASLMGLGVGAGDIVLTTPFSFFASAGVIARLGAEPRFVDIEADTYTMAPEALAAWFETNDADANRVKAIMPVHLYGQCARMDPIMELARERGIAVVEDACQAIGAGYPSGGGADKKSGAIGTTGCFSFFPSKNLGCLGDAGMIVTSDAELAERLRKLRMHGEVRRYHHTMIGGNFRIDPLQAAVLSVKLPYLDGWCAMRRENAAYYDERLAKHGIVVPATPYGRQAHTYHQYVISVSERRDELKAALDKADIGNAIYYPVPFHQQECFEYLGYRLGDFPATEYAADHTIALPIYPEVTREMQDYVIENVVGFYS